MGVRYVRPDGSNSGNDCSNAFNPCASIQQAVDMAAANDDIWVAGGTYTDLSVRQGITQAVYLSKSLTILGGFNATFASAAEPQLNPTVVNATNQGRVVYVSGGTDVTLSGLTLVNGRTNGSGGGIHSQEATLTIRETAILSSQAEFGGGVYALRGSLLIEDSMIAYNSARLGGGGLRLYQTQTQMNDNTINNNTAVLHGGGLYLSFVDGRLEDNQISNNQVTTVDQGWGGGLHLHNSPLTLAFNQIDHNSADYGGGLRLYQSAATLNGNLIQNNQANIAGGLSLEAGSHALLINNAVVDNTAVSLASGVRILNANPTLQQTTIARNSGAEGSGLLLENGQMTLTNSLIAEQAIGIQNDNGIVTLTATLWDNVTQPTVGSVSDNLSQNGNAAFAADGVHLTAVSDAIDNGIDDGINSDIDNQPRPYGTGFDLGAHEWRSLTAVKTASATVAESGDNVTYTISLSQPLTNSMMVLLTDTLPSEVTFVGPLTYSSGSGAYASGVITWTGQVQTDTTVIIQFPVQLNAGLIPGTIISNQADLQDAVGTYESNTAVVTIPSKLYLPIVLRQSND